MYKLLPIFLFAFGFADKIEVYYNSDRPIGGFQFHVDGDVEVLSADGGAAGDASFEMFAGKNTVVGFSLTGATIAAGEGVFVVLDVAGNTSAACLIDFVISDSYGRALNVNIENCISIIISENEIYNSPDGQIRGRIDNLEGEPIIGAQVFIEELGIGTITDIDGYYILFNIPPGSYDITASMINYQTEIYSNIEVIMENTVWLNFILDCDTCPKPSGIINTFYNDSWAVIVGINEYEYNQGLNYAVQDARDIKDLLISNFSFPKENITLLTDQEATLTNIRSKLYEIADTANEGDRILVYFAGHGETRTLKSGGEKGYLIPADGNIEEIFTTCLPMSEIREIANVTAAKHVLFLIDVCFGGLATLDTRSLSKSTPGYIDKITKDKARQIITAGGKGEKVIEKSEWGHSAFAKNLIHGLESTVADQDYDGYITADELGSFLIKRVSIDSENLQTPLKRRFGSGEGEFVFLVKKIIESAIIGILPNNIYERDEIPSVQARQVHQRLINDISYLYGDKAAKNILRDLARLKEEREKNIQIIYGCRNEKAVNYNHEANFDDGSCIILELDDVYIEFGDFHNRDSTLDVWMASDRRIYNLEIITSGFDIIDVLDGNLVFDNITTSFDIGKIYVEFSDSLDGYIIPKEGSLLFRAKILPTDDIFCINGVTINEYDTENVEIGQCVTGLTVQEVALLDSMEVEIISDDYSMETGKIIQTTEEGKYDILLEDSTMVHDVDPSEVKITDPQVLSNLVYIKNVDYINNIVEIGVNSLEEVAGFQLDITGVNLDDGHGGAAQENGFMISTGGSTALAFSLTGATIEAGKYTLVYLDVSTIHSTEICLEWTIFSDANGNAIDVVTGPCWVH